MSRQARVLARIELQAPCNLLTNQDKGNQPSGSGTYGAVPPAITSSDSLYVPQQPSTGHFHLRMVMETSCRPQKRVQAPNL